VIAEIAHDWISLLRAQAQRAFGGRRGAVRGAFQQALSLRGRPGEITTLGFGAQRFVASGAGANPEPGQNHVDGLDPSRGELPSNGCVARVGFDLNVQWRLQNSLFPIESASVSDSSSSPSATVAKSQRSRRWATEPSTAIARPGPVAARDDSLDAGPRIATPIWNDVDTVRLAPPMVPEFARVPVAFRF